MNISIEPEKVEMLTNKGIRIVIILICMFLSIKIGNYIIKKVVDRQIKSQSRLSLNTQRAKTLGEVSKSILKYSVYFTGILLILSNIFGNISYTFAGIGGVVVGLGVQSLVKDIINGFFILFENQFGVGDYVVIGEYQGIVKSIGIKTTVIQGLYGDVHCISNGSIKSVTNNSKLATTFFIDIIIDYKEDIEEVIEIISDKCEEYKKTNEDLYETEVLGIEDLSIYGVKLRIMGKCKPLKNWDISRNIRREINTVLKKNGVEISCINNRENKERIVADDR